MKKKENVGQQRRPLKALFSEIVTGKEQSYTWSLSPGVQQNPKINEQTKANRGAESRAGGKARRDQGRRSEERPTVGPAPRARVQPAGTPQLSRKQAYRGAMGRWRPNAQQLKSALRSLWTCFHSCPRSESPRLASSDLTLAGDHPSYSSDPQHAGSWVTFAFPGYSSFSHPEIPKSILGRVSTGSQPSAVSSWRSQPAQSNSFIQPSYTQVFSQTVIYIFPDSVSRWICRKHS